jgi:tRNA nucleotidyltransferase (CCA-adding enzyme)
MEVYEVGGAVRDAMLGLAIHERDWVVVGSNAAELLAIGYRQVGKDFPVFLHPQTNEEYALARTERKTAAVHLGFELNAAEDVTLHQDLLRRDLTINAMARDETGHLIDPYGGQRDLENRVLRHVSSAFREDPLRVLRVARLAATLGAFDFKPAPETLDLMRLITASGELGTLPAERLWQETAKALAAPRPDRYVEILRDCGALAILFPEVDKLFGVPQPKRWHPEIDTGVHLLMALRQAARISPKTSVRFAVLVHDLGKGTTPVGILPSHKGHEERSIELLSQLCRRLRVPRKFEELGNTVARYHGSAHRALELTSARLHDLLVEIGAFRNAVRIEDFLQACEADARGRAGLEDQHYPQADFLRQALQVALKISGADVSSDGLDGPQFGASLRQRRIDAIAAARDSFAKSE